MKKIALLFAAAMCAAAQTFTGSITGLVSDSGGANVPKAAVSITNDATREVRAVESNSDGRYTFSQLQPGTYTLKVTLAGFREYVC